MKQWIKFYSEALHDRKMRRLSRIDKSVFYDLLLLAGQEDINGYLPSIEDIAFELDMDTEEAEASLSNLLKIGVISKDEEGVLFVTMFNERQNSNLSDAERAKKYREKKKVSTTVTDGEKTSRDERHADVCDERSNDDERTVTVEKNRIEKNRIEIDKDKNRIEKNRIENINDADAPRTPSKKRNRGILKPYGIAENVMLSDEEYLKLQEKLGSKGADEQIDALSLYMGQSEKNAKKYTNHYLTVLNWSRLKEEHAMNPAYSRPKERTFADIAREMETANDNTIESFWRD